MYTITEVGKLTGLPASTLRYYEEEGILPQVDRNDIGRRVYSEEVLAWLELVLALKNTGMSIERIKSYTAMITEGDDRLTDRREMLVHHKQEVEQTLAKTQTNLEKIIRKIAVYDVLMHRQLKNKDPLI
ncbi:MerR family transcriptional regulator [Exiguobacterium artemiae]